MNNNKNSIFATIQAPDEQWLARAAAEPVLEPELPIIDTHLHLWAFQGHRYFLDEYLADLAVSGHNVQASVFVECFQRYRETGPEHLKYAGETEFAVDLARQSAARAEPRTQVAAGIVGYADLSQGERTAQALEEHLRVADGRLVGIRQRAKWDADPVVKGQYSADRAGLYLDAAFGRGIQRLGELGLAFDASIYHPQMPDVTALARAHPQVQIVLIHCGSPVGHGAYAGHERDNHQRWLRDLRELATCPNVSVKMGGLLMNIGNYDFTQHAAPLGSEALAELWRPYLEPCVELFGAGRCMVSSNFPVDKAGFAYRTVWNLFKRITTGCSVEEKSLIYSGTAQRVYGLSDAACSVHAQPMSAPATVAG
ncbi:amidohydrolase family protein [Pseudomonas hunanensis]|uniref:amidohydrolase family protein n=1 Tax=Pseudomonas hunanensis TaxID=1247546 RepID=UPI00382D3F25